MSEASTQFCELLLTYTKKNKIFVNVLILIADSFPDERKNIAHTVISLLTTENCDLMCDFVASLVEKSEEYRKCFSECRYDWGQLGREGTRVSEALEGKELVVPPELFFYGLKSKEEYLNNNYVLVECYIKGIREKMEVKSREYEEIGKDTGNDHGVKRMKVREGGKERMEDMGREGSRESVSYTGRDSSRNRNGEGGAANRGYSTGGSRDEYAKDRTKSKMREERRNTHEGDKFAVLYQRIQCRLCALRFTDTEEGKTHYGTHLEEHNRRKRVEQQKDTISRTYFPNEDNWLSKKIELPLARQEEHKLFVGKKLVICNLCNEKMDVEWDDDNDSWVVRDAVKLGDGNGYVHRECAF